jgi:hypothetical protein
MASPPKVDFLSWIKNSMLVKNDVSDFSGGVLNPEAKGSSMHEAMQEEYQTGHYGDEHPLRRNRGADFSPQPPEQPACFLAKCAFCHDRITSNVFMYNDQQFCSPLHRMQAETLQAQGKSSALGSHHLQPSPSPYVDSNRTYQCWI